MNVGIYDVMSHVWGNASNGEAHKFSEVEVALKDRLLNILQVGDSYYFIFNLQTSSFEKISHGITKVLDYTPVEYDIPTFLSCIHPEDQPWFVRFEKKVVEFFTNLPPEHVPHYKISYDFRIKKRNGDYIRMLQQLLTIDYDGKGAFFRTLGIHTDISHIKAEGRPVLSFIGLNGLPSYINMEVDEQEPVVFQHCDLSRREREVLLMLVNGMRNREIAEKLSISKETVASHRKNMLTKAGVRNTAELIGKAVKENWI